LPRRLSCATLSGGMTFKQFSRQGQSVEGLQRALARGRLGHACLFVGDRMEELETIARTLAKTLNCRQPVQQNGVAVDCCDGCVHCRRIENETHPDVHWARPESRSRVITIDQMRELMREIQLKPAEAAFKVAIIVAADRLNLQAANAFLKTLEEPPPDSFLILLSTEPQRLLETVLSRCLRLNFHSAGARQWDAPATAWLQQFSALAVGEQKTLLGRYRLLDALLRELGEIRSQVEQSLTARSPLQKHDEAEAEWREKWEKELTAAIESEYRRRRAELLRLLQEWLRDVWLHSLAVGKEWLNFPQIAGAEILARKISPRQALENLETLEHTQQLLQANVQEALALEVGLLKLHL